MSRWLFPPGDTHSAKPVRSRWRETAFMLRQIQHAVDPLPSLRESIEVWSEVVEHLNERPRKRRLQLETLAARAPC